MTRTPTRMALIALLPLTLALGLPASGGDARAAAPRDATARAQALGDRAREAFEAQDYEHAIALYLQAYETARSAGFLYNIAFIYKSKLDDAELALQYFERVLGEADADEAMRERATAHVAELRAVMAARNDGKTGDGKTGGPGDGKTGGPGDGETGGPGDGKTGGPGDGKTGGPGDGKTGDGKIVAPPGRVDPPPTKSATPWIVMGIGAGALAGGVVMGVVASGTESDYQAAGDVSSRRDLQSTGQTQALVADVLMVAGAAAIVVGFVLWLDDDGEGGQGSVYVAPAPLPAGGAITFGGRL